VNFYGWKTAGHRLGLQVQCPAILVYGVDYPSRSQQFCEGKGEGSAAGSEIGPNTVTFWHPLPYEIHMIIVVHGEIWYNLE
jgi:hypothetical protein